MRKIGGTNLILASYPMTLVLNVWPNFASIKSYIAIFFHHESFDGGKQEEDNAPLLFVLVPYLMTLVFNVWPDYTSIKRYMAAKIKP